LLSLLLVGAAAMAVSALTLFSGFGLGTLLLPAFALLLPIKAAVAATAVVHLLNNLFKLSLLGKQVDGRLLRVFGLPALAAAFPGAWLLTVIPDTRWRTWSLGAQSFAITPLGLLMGGLILAFALFELAPGLQRFRFAPRWLPAGGVLSGFFGGLSGHQGALRAAFLSPLGLKPAVFAATQAAIACLVDVARLLLYGLAVLGGGTLLATREHWPLIAVATVCAFAGAWVGTRLLPRVTVGFVRGLTGVLLVIVGLGLALGMV
jgi:uncharacterized membrane protein YfcA